VIGFRDSAGLRPVRKDGGVQTRPSKPDGRRGVGFGVRDVVDIDVDVDGTARSERTAEGRRFWRIGSGVETIGPLPGIVSSESVFDEDRGRVPIGRGPIVPPGPISAGRSPDDPETAGAGVVSAARVRELGRDRTGAVTPGTTRIGPPLAGRGDGS
jgi:hypothetical protein